MCCLRALPRQDYCTDTSHPLRIKHTHTVIPRLFFSINVAHNERMLSSSCSWLLSAATQQLSLRWTSTPTSCPRCQETEIWSLQMFVCVSKAEFRDVSLNQAGPQKNTDNPLVLLLFYLCYHGNHSQQNLRSCCVSEWAPSGYRGYCVPSLILFKKQLKKLTFQDKNKILWILLSDFILDVQLTFDVLPLTCRTGNAFLAVVVPVRLVCLGLAFGC